MDPLSLIAIAKSAAEFVPAVAKWFGGDDDASTASEIIDVAQRVTGMAEPSDAIAHLHENPDLQVAFQQAMNPVMIARLENQTKQLAEINITMRAELNSQDKFKSYWRPGFGWALLFTWTVTMLSLIFILGYVVIKNPQDLSAVLSGIASVMGPFSIMWGVALSVLGINISARSQDKAVASGHTPALGIIGAITQRIGGKRG